MDIKTLDNFYLWIKSNYEFIEEMNSKMPYGNKFKLFFRGENKNNNELIPAIYRNGRAINEHKIFNEAINHAPSSFSDCKTTFEKLVIMQHYGIPTRLLDITENPLVALYFATDGNKTEYDGKIYCFFVSEKAIEFPNSFNTSILANISVLDSMLFFDGNTLNNFISYINKLKEYSEKDNFAERRYLYAEANKELLLNPMIKILFGLSEKESGYSPSNFSIDNIARIACVKPKSNNYRVMSQGSAFLLFGFLGDKNFCLPLSSYKIFKVYKDILLKKFNSKEKREAEKELIRMLPLNKTILEEILKKDQDFSLTHFASGRRSDLSREISREKPNLLSKIIDDEFNLPLNVHMFELTHRLKKAINRNLSKYFILDNILNFIWSNYPIIFYDEIKIPKTIKANIQKELSYFHISKSSLFPELESSSKEISNKYDHSQPLIITKHKDDLIVCHIDKKVNTDLREGDIIISPKFDSVDEFWGSFVIHETLNLKIKRKSEPEELNITINCYDFSTKDNPLFANFSEH